MNTPWGQSDYCKELRPHVWNVCTPSHGGIMVAKGTAARILSTEAVKRGRVFGGYVCFEEDCDWALVAYELPELFVRDDRGLAQVREAALKTISRYAADYLLARGIEPEPEAYARFKRSREDERLRGERCPDLIVAARANDDGSIHVWTADGLEHEIEGGSYDRVNYRLSNCRVLAARGEK